MNHTTIIFNTTLVSNNILELSRRINISANVLVAFIGLIGHSLIILVFSQKRFRTNTSNVFLLCLAVNDSFFLIIHILEDTIRTYKDVYINETNSHYLFNRLIISLDFTDKHQSACVFINFLRYTLRFTSSYIQVAFTLQRLSIVFSPLNNRFKSKKCAWVTCFMISIVSMSSNFWAFFMFELQTDSFSSYCDVKKNWSNEYFQITAVYIIVVVMIPILIIFMSNSLIIISLAKAESARKHLKNKSKSKIEISSTNKRDKTRSNRGSKSIPQTVEGITNKTCQKNLSVSHNFYCTPSDITPSSKLKPFYSSMNHVANRSMSKSSTSTKNSTKILMLVSFVFISLNLPYLIIWFVFYYQMAFTRVNIETKDYMFALLQICEVFYMLNYSVLFYIYCASGSKFRNQLKHSIFTRKQNAPKVEFYVENVCSNSKFI